MKTFLIPIFLLWSVVAMAQDAPPQSPTYVDGDTSKKIFYYVEQMPRAPYDLGAYLSSHMHYPQTARENKVEGRVIVKFEVDKKGRICDCTVTKGIGSGCDEEALRVIEGMPRWKPGKNRTKTGEGKLHPINVWYTLPIVFKLAN